MSNSNCTYSIKVEGKTHKPWNLKVVSYIYIGPSSFTCIQLPGLNMSPPTLYIWNIYISHYTSASLQIKEETGATDPPLHLYFWLIKLVIFPLTSVPSTQFHILWYFHGPLGQVNGSFGVINPLTFWLSFYLGQVPCVLFLMLHSSIYFNSTLFSTNLVLLWLWLCVTWSLVV